MHVDSVVSGNRARPAQRLCQRTSIYELEIASRFGGALTPQEPFFSGREKSRNVSARRRGVTLDFAREPGFDGEDVGRRPYAPPLRELSRRVGEPCRMGPLA